MLILVLVFGLPRGHAKEEVPSASALRADLAQYADSPPPPEAREAWVRYAEQTGDTLPVGALLATLSPAALADADQAGEIHASRVDPASEAYPLALARRARAVWWRACEVYCRHTAKGESSSPTR